MAVSKEINKELLEYKLNDMKSDIDELKETIKESQTNCSNGLNEILKSINEIKTVQALQQTKIDELNKPVLDKEQTKLILKVFVGLTTFVAGAFGVVIPNIDKLMSFFN